MATTFLRELGASLRPALAGVGIAAGLLGFVALLFAWTLGLG